MPKVENVARARAVTGVRAAVATLICLIFLIPVLWMALTAFKPREAIISVPPRFLFQPSLEGFVGLLTQRSTLTKMQMERYQQRTDLTWMDRIALERGLAIIGPSQYVNRLLNSVIISFFSTGAAVILGVLAAYAFSRFRVSGTADWQFFILSTRMLPPVVVTIPIFLMYRAIGLFDTHIGMILLYTVFNLSLSVWLLKGFIDEIPKEYEEAALIDGYSRWQAFTRIVLPQAITGIAATTVFCLIFAWNEYAFALMLTSDK
jgi:multiple sugar transport system permease protein